MTRPTELLVVEDEEPQRRVLADILRAEGYVVRDAPHGERALELIAERPPEVILSDWRMPVMDGSGLLAEVRRRELPTAFIVMTAYGSIAHAVEAMQSGADDYLSKPFERDALLLAIRRVLRTQRLEHENRRLREEARTAEGFGTLLGRARAMQQLFVTMKKVADTDATVLITGESGTGKELVARTLHATSARARGPFVAVNCGAIPAALMESELFGHEKGAFTGALRQRHGKFEEADQGTLFLDEIASMPLPVQSAVLRVLQDQRFTRVGGQGEQSSDVRVVAAANRDLAQMVREGGFRDDLYYRLNVVPISVPPLRERSEDIPLLAAAFAEQAARRHTRPPPALEPELLRCLVAYGWPGNVRELANLIERLVLLSDGGVLRPEDLPAEIRMPSPMPHCPFRLPADGLDWEAMEVGLLRQALERAGGNRTAAARLLSLSYKTFLYRLEKHCL